MSRENPPDGESPLDPAAMLELLEQQQLAMNRRMARLVPAILAAWGIAWGVGFTLLWLVDGARPAFAVPLPVAVVAFTVLMVAALATSGVLGAMTGRGIRSTPDAAFTGAAYGITWTVGFIAIFVFGLALGQQGMSDELANIFYPTATAMFVGIMYLVAGAIWHARPALAMGAWIVVVSVVAPFFGYPAHYLFFAIAGGGVFIVGAIAVAVWVFGRRPIAGGGG
jgi:hypothetical protein